MYILEAKNLKKYYNAGTTVKALDGVDFQIKQGEFVSIVGSSGSGKSTFLNLLGGLDKATEGSVNIKGKEILQMTEDELTIFRRRNIGFVFQNYNLIPILNVMENITLPMELDGNKPDKEYIKEIVNILGLSEKLRSMPNELSGGQQQRVAIARAIVSKPAIILADEPTGNLDSKASMDVMGIIKLSVKKFGQTVVMITHNPEIAQMADRTLRIEDGRFV